MIASQIAPINIADFPTSFAPGDLVFTPFAQIPLTIRTEARDLVSEGRVFFPSLSSAFGAADYLRFVGIERNSDFQDRHERGPFATYLAMAKPLGSEHSRVVGIAGLKTRSLGFGRKRDVSEAAAGPTNLDCLGFFDAPAFIRGSGRTGLIGHTLNHLRSQAQNVSDVIRCSARFAMPITNEDFVETMRAYGFDYENPKKPTILRGRLPLHNKNVETHILYATFEPQTPTQAS
jgi:hypothetical protein